MDLTGARVLITGGAGLVGSHIADKLVDENVTEIVVVDNLTRGSRDNLAQAMARGRVTFLDVDIRDAAAVRRAMDGIDLVFHQAAIRITQCAEQPRTAVDVLIGGTFNVLDAAVQAGVKKVAAKVADEQILRSFNDMYGLPYVALRYFNIYGPRMDVFGVYTEVMIRWIERIEAAEPPLIYGDGTQSMDFVYITDVAAANIAAMKSAVSDDVFNVASGTEVSLNELATALLELMGRPDLRPEHREERKVNSVRRRQATTAKARDMLGFTASVGLREGLQGLIDWRRGLKDVA
jgi:UDP-glucose 4-epimerase